MKKIFLTGLSVFAAGGLLIFSPAHLAVADDEKPVASEPVVKRNANGEMVVKVDAATQKLIKLEVANPTMASWQPTVKAYGRVLDPTPLIMAVTDLATARTSAEASAKEYDRLKTLAAQDNASARAVETAQLAAEHDRLSLESLQAKFAGDWGLSLAAQNDLPEFVRQLTARKSALVRLELAAGEQLTEAPVATALTVFPDDTHLVPATLVELNLGVNPQTQGQFLLFLVNNHLMPLGAAVTGQLSISGKPLSGVEVPATAILRHEGRGWVYLQTGDDEFTRHEIPLDRLTQNGWFVNGGLSTTNNVVTGGAETVLSAELRGGGFNTGMRD